MIDSPFYLSGYDFAILNQKIAQSIFGLFRKVPKTKMLILLIAFSADFLLSTN
jgi:hypothetical protein